jgi:hypothetical protein
LDRSVDFYLNALGDEYAPSVPKPELQQYSPYQTDDIYCVDVTNRITNQSGEIIDTRKNELQETLAVQAYAIEPIPVNFNQIAKDYP